MQDSSLCWFLYSVKRPIGATQVSSRSLKRENPYAFPIHRPGTFFTIFEARDLMARPTWM